MAKDFFNEMGESLSKTAQGLSERVSGMVEVQKLKSKIASEERQIQKIMMEIGKLVYDKYAGNSDGSGLEEKFSSMCAAIREHHEVIDVLKGEAASRRGKKICPNCKKSVEKTVAFCPYCGTPVPSETPEEKKETAEVVFDETEEDEMMEDWSEGQVEDVSEDEDAFEDEDYDPESYEEEEEDALTDDETEAGPED